MNDIKKRETGKRIKIARESKGLKQKDLAELLGMDCSNWSRIEKGEVMPTVKSLIKINEILDVSIDFILTGKKFVNGVEAFEENSEDIQEMLNNMMKYKKVKYGVLELYLTYMEKIRDSLKELKKENNEENNNG